MKRMLCLLLLGMTAYAATGQDFATKFMSQTNCPDELYCQTVSPKMMEKLINLPEASDKEKTNTLLEKLKSARIITATSHAKSFFNRARALIEHNPNRFLPLGEYPKGCTDMVFVRKHDQIIVELVMLCYNESDSLFTAINLTGNMDGQFIDQLSAKNENDSLQ